jgi:predicted negative regulator of RcsB-dependent stress response
MAGSPEWRSFWEAKLKLFDGDAEGRETMGRLARSANNDVAVAALLDIAELHESDGALEEAADALRNAAAAASDPATRLLCNVRLAHVFNVLGRCDEALRVFGWPAVSFEKVDEDGVQFVMTELGVALLRTNRREEAATLFRTLIAAYPGRAELTAIRDALQDR